MLTARPHLAHDRLAGSTAKEGHLTPAASGGRARTHAANLPPPVASGHPASKSVVQSCSRAAVLHEPGSTRRSTVAGESPVRGCAVSADGVARRSKLPELDKQEVKALIRTALCDLLGIEHPIIQAGMGPFAPASLAADEGRGRMGRARRSAPPEEAYGLLEGCGALSRCPHGGLRRRFCCGGNDHYCSSG